MSEVREKAKLAGTAVSVLNRLTTAQKNDALLAVADALVRNSDAILAANEEDLQRGRDNGTSSSLL
ncbi:gamma-glutamyl-phosphate reductase, partial [Paenibacillus barengoltzii]|nr:gamma-glutamyl-phosphate reductase [Paenibacillus barengoltzii]